MNLFSRNKPEDTPLDPPAQVRAAAQAAFDKWKESATAAKEAEKELFSALFDEKAGLKQPYADADDRRQAVHLRYSLAKSAQEAAVQIGCNICDRFVTDGNVNMGAGPEYYWARVFSGQAR